MNPKLFIVSRGSDGKFGLPDGSRVNTRDVPVGAMWRCECHGEQGWMIRIPGEDHWPDGHVFGNLWCTAQTVEGGAGWTVMGEAPNITVTPSIHCSPGEGAERGEWHGHIVNGEFVG